ncbi:unnamed protein product [Schistocephalus solidus]|uniref:CKK domain-containing protein n=1 Tax=Schistocephalus solidus TaxID=70667 RepID=A0A183SZD0_SCHSO|nr:unnamed protein product [Schistocephalus solidus]
MLLPTLVTTVVNAVSGQAFALVYAHFSRVENSPYAHQGSLCGIADVESCPAATLQRHFSSHRRLELTALDSGEERMHAPYSRRPRDMGENRLGYSTGTGLDQLAIEELARSVTNLKSDIERLTLQQQSFMDSAAPRSLEPPIEGDSMNGQDVVANRPRPPRNLHSAQSVGRLHHSPNNKPITPSTSRATWNARTSLRYPSQADMQSTNLGQANCELVPTGPLSAFNLSNAAVQNGVQTAPTSLLAAEQFTEAREAASNSSDSKETTPIPESQRAPEQLFIAFEDPQSERLRRARERIEARIAAERRQNTEKTLRARHAKVEAQVIGEISHRQELDLRHEEEKSPDPSSPISPLHRDARERGRSDTDWRTSARSRGNVVDPQRIFLTINTPYARNRTENARVPTEQPNPSLLRHAAAETSAKHVSVLSASTYGGIIMAKEIADKDQKTGMAILFRDSLRDYNSNSKAQQEADNTQPAESLFPVHTTTFDSQPAATVVEASRPPSAVGVKKPAVASNRNPSAATSHTSRWSSSSAAQRGKAACSVSSSQAGSRVTSTNGSRRLPNGASGSGETEGSELETEDTEHKFATTPRHRSSSRQSIGKLSAGRSLSSLHRLTSGEDSAYSGPGLPVAGLPQTRLYAKPKPKSNRAVIVNAISHCCLAGTVNESIKKTTLQELAAVDGSHFIVLFRDSRCQYRALYAFDPESEDLHLISGSGPRKVIHKMVEKFFKYNSGLKQFTEITSTKHLSTVVDAITIQNNFWARNSSIATAAARGNLSQSINGGHP